MLLDIHNGIAYSSVYFPLEWNGQWFQSATKRKCRGRNFSIKVQNLGQSKRKKIRQKKGRSAMQTGSASVIKINININVKITINTSGDESRQPPRMLPLCLKIHAACLPARAWRRDQAWLETTMPSNRSSFRHASSASFQGLYGVIKMRPN